jgi:tetratricopeptide (TPR) repeat protein
MSSLGDQPLVVTREAGVATLWLNRPEKRNAVDYAMWLELAALATELGTDPSVRVLVVRGVGDHFCAGGDISGLGDLPFEEYTRANELADRALAEFQQVLETDPGFVSARYRVGQVLLAKGEAQEALVPLWEADRQTRGLAKGRALIAYALASADRRREAEAMLDALLKERERTYVSATLIALAYVGLGEGDRAFEWLERGCEEHAEWMHLVAVEPLLDTLRGDPRFASVLKCAGLSPP